MKYLLVVLLFFSRNAEGQHCPWDCSGLVVIQTNMTAAEMVRFKPVLVDENKSIVIDTIYGTGGKTWDTARVLPFEAFQQYRTERIQLHRWYNYDTMYRFAAGYYVAKANYCKFAHTGRKLFVRFTLQPPGKNPVYRDIEIAGKGLLHLHDYSIELNQKDAEGIRKRIAALVLTIQRSDLGLR